MLIITITAPVNLIVPPMTSVRPYIWFRSTCVPPCRALNAYLDAKAVEEDEKGRKDKEHDRSLDRFPRIPKVKDPCRGYDERCKVDRVREPVNVVLAHNSSVKWQASGVL